MAEKKSGFDRMEEKQIAQGKKRMDFVERGVDAVARKLGIGTFQAKDGRTVTSSDLSPADKKIVASYARDREDAKARIDRGSVSPGFRGMAEGERDKKAAQEKINKVYAERAAKMK